MNVNMDHIIAAGLLDWSRIINEVVVGVTVAILGLLYTAVRIGLRTLQAYAGAIVYCVDRTRHLDHDVQCIKADCRIRLQPYPPEFATPPQISDYIQSD